MYCTYHVKNDNLRESVEHKDAQIVGDSLEQYNERTATSSRSDTMCIVAKSENMIWSTIDSINVYLYTINRDIRTNTHVVSADNR